MVHLSKLAVGLSAFSAIAPVLAHPGETHDAEHVKRELRIRDHIALHSKRSLAACDNSLKSRALKERALARRAATAKELREKRGLPTNKPYKRDLAELEMWEEHSHQQNNTGYTVNTAETNIFSANTSCVLTPEEVVGPYYVSGELVRSNVTEDQVGVPVHLEMQFIDTSTCEPIKDLVTDIWACNATGIYSGIAEAQSAGEGGLDTDFLRGIQVSDSDGVVEFDTNFPGHYEGRATHQHLITRVNSTLLPNSTYTGGTVNHIGQLFFDEALRAMVEATYPYSTNEQPILSNNDDSWAPVAASEEYDPFPDYVMLGDTVSDGLLMWISIGVNITANYTDVAYIASYWEEGGGVENFDDGFYSDIASSSNSSSSATTLSTVTTTASA